MSTSSIDDSVGTIEYSVPGGIDAFVNAKFGGTQARKKIVEPAFYKFQAPGGNHDELAKCALATLRQIEKEGGSAAFEAWLKETENGRKKPPLPDHVEQALATVIDLPVEAWEEIINSRKKNHFPGHDQQARFAPHPSLLYSIDFVSSEPIYVAPRNSYDGVAVSIYSGIAYTYISVDVIGQGITGSGGGWGLGLGAMWGLGTLIIPEGFGTIQEWSQNIEFFAITALAGTAGGAMVGFFTKSGGPGSGQILVAGGGVLGAIGFGGEFKFRG